MLLMRTYVRPLLGVFFPQAPTTPPPVYPVWMMRCSDAVFWILLPHLSICWPTDNNIQQHSQKEMSFSPFCYQAAKTDPPKSPTAKAEEIPAALSWVAGCECLLTGQCVSVGVRGAHLKCYIHQCHSWGWRISDKASQILLNLDGAIEWHVSNLCQNIPLRQSTYTPVTTVSLLQNVFLLISHLFGNFHVGHGQHRAVGTWPCQAALPAASWDSDCCDCGLPLNRPAMLSQFTMTNAPPRSASDINDIWNTQTKTVPSDAFKDCPIDDLTWPTNHGISAGRPLHIIV